MEQDQLVANLVTLIAALVRMKPNSVKGTYIRSVGISSTMGPGVWIDTLDVQKVAESV